MIRTAEEIKATLVTLDKAMRAGATVAASDRPCLYSKGCTCSTCRPGGKR